jgi:hypothetical protein
MHVRHCRAGWYVAQIDPLHDGERMKQRSRGRFICVCTVSVFKAFRIELLLLVVRLVELLLIASCGHSVRNQQLNWHPFTVRLGPCQVYFSLVGIGRAYS